MDTSIRVNNEYIEIKTWKFKRCFCYCSFTVDFWYSSRIFSVAFVSAYEWLFLTHSKKASVFRKSCYSPKVLSWCVHFLNSLERWKINLYCFERCSFFATKEVNLSLLRVEAHLTSSADLTIILASVCPSEICAVLEKKNLTISILERNRKIIKVISTEQWQILFTTSAYLKTPIFPFCTINTTALPFQSIFIFTSRLKVNSTLLHDEWIFRPSPAICFIFTRTITQSIPTDRPS